MKGLRKFVSLMGRSCAMTLLVSALAGTAVSSWASTTGSAVWTTQADFESNASTTGTQTTRVNIDTATAPGDVRIGASKDFLTTATITRVMASNKIYTTGIDRTSVAVIDGPTKALIGKIDIAARVAGVVYNSTNNKLYVGHYNDNKVSVLDCATDTIIQTLTVGGSAYAAAYNGINNKVYIANTGDQTVSIFDGATDSLLATVPVTAGSTTVTFDAVENKVYLTSKSNAYMTIIDGVTDQVVKSFQIDNVVNLLGGQAPGNVGLRVDSQTMGVTAADSVQLSWNYDSLGPNMKIRFQVRTAQAIPDLDSAVYQGPDGTAGTWYDLSSTGATTVVEADGTETTMVDLATPLAAATEIQVQLSDDDGITTPVLHAVTLFSEYSINASATGGGTIAPSGVVKVRYGDSKTFTMTPLTGYHIADVVVDGVSQGAITSYTFNNVVTGHTIAATFAIDVFTITASAGSGGTIAPSGAVRVNYGSDQSFTITANTGYHIVDVVVDGVSQGPISSYTFPNVRANHTIAASFDIDVFIITASAGSGGTIAPSGAVRVNYGSDQTFTITANTGYHIVDVVVDGVSQGPISSYTFPNVRANHTIAATFAVTTYTITFSAGTGGSITGTTTQTVAYGGSTTPVTAVPSSGYHFASWTGTNGFVTTSANPLTVTNVTASQTITANFAPISFSRTWQATVVGSYAVALDNGGNVYTTVSSGIAKFTPPAQTPVWTASAGGTVVRGVSVDASGNVYTAAGLLFSKFTPPATAPVWTGGGNDANQIITDAAGNIYAADYAGWVYTYAFTPPSTYTLTRQMQPYGSATQGIAVDSANDLFYLTYNGYYGYYAPGQSTAAKNTMIFTNTSPIHSIVIDNSNNSYVLGNDNGGTLSRIPHGSTTANWKVTGVGSILTGVAVDGVGNVYVAAGSTLKMYTPASGTGLQWSTTITGSNFGGVAVDASGQHIAAIELTNNTVDLYTRN